MLPKFTEDSLHVLGLYLKYQGSLPLRRVCTTVRLHKWNFLFASKAQPVDLKCRTTTCRPGFCWGSLQLARKGRGLAIASPRTPIPRLCESTWPLADPVAETGGGTPLQFSSPPLSSRISPFPFVSVPPLLLPTPLSQPSSHSLSLSYPPFHSFLVQYGSRPVASIDNIIGTNAYNRQNHWGRTSIWVTSPLQMLASLFHLLIFLASPISFFFLKKNMPDTTACLRKIVVN